MNKDYTIVSKGIYTHKQTSEFLHIDRFIVIRKKTGRYLLLELSNLHKDVLTSATFQIDQIDARGNSLGFVNASFNDLSFKNGKFVLKEQIKLHHACLDVRVKVLKAKYGELVYSLGGNDTFATIEKKEKREPVNRKKVQKTVGEDGYVAAARRFKSPVFIGVFLLLLVVLSCGAIFLHLNDFSSRKKDFYLANVEYAFVDGDSSEGSDVYVKGFIGLGGENVKIPAEVDGHRVVKIAEGAFKDNEIMQVLTIEGDVIIEKEAFANCQNLTEINLLGVSTIQESAFANCENLKKVKSTKLRNLGNNAFADCVSLNNVLIEDAQTNNTLNIGENAFYGCGNINTIKINQFIAYPEGRAILSGVSGVENLYLKNFNYEKYDAVVNSDKPLSAIFGTSQDVYLSKVEIDYMDYIPEYFAQDVKTTLTKFTINNLTDEVIGQSAFAQCENLTDFITSVKITDVGENAFKDSSITYFDLSKTSTLGLSAFDGCQKLETVVTSQDTLLQTIPENAFRNCVSLTEFTVPEIVSDIQKCAFQNSGITKIQFAQNNLLTIINQSVFEGCAKLSNVEIPQGVKIVDDKAFLGCTELTSIKLPNELTRIGHYSFACCNKITGLVVPDSVTNIGIGALALCESINSLTVPFIGDASSSPQETKLGYLFIYPNENGQVQTPVEDNSSVPTSLKTVKITKGLEIGKGAFKDCADITTISMPNTIKQICSEAFSGCVSIKDIKLSDDLMQIRENAFYGCANLRSLVLPSEVWYIGNNAFGECYRLFEVTDLCSMSTDSVKSYFPYAIGVYASEQEALQSKKADINGYTFIQAKYDTSRYTKNNWYLINHTQTKEIVLPINPYATTYSLPERYFYNDSAIESITVPSQVAEIGAKQFANSSNLKKAIFESGGKLKVDGSIFANCEKLEVLDMLGRNISSYGFDSSNIYNCDALKDVKLPYGVTSIDSQWFANKNKLTNLEMPNTVKTIGQQAFAGCTELKSVIMPGVTNVNSYMFNQCPALENVYAPSANEVGDYAFAYCQNLKTVNVENASTISRHAFYYCTSLTSINLPQATSVEEYAFSNCQSLKTINIDNVYTIYDNAFSYCTSLTSVNLPNIDSIGNNAFSSCQSLNTINISNVYDVGNNAFSDCVSLTSISMPYVNEILSGTFVNCRSLSTVNIVNAKYIYENAFYNCASLNGVNLPYVVEILDGAFEECKALSTVSGRSVQYQLEYVGDSAFLGCSNLTSIILDYVDYIGERAFEGCASLNNIKLSNYLQTIPAYAFSGCSSLSSITIPAKTTSIKVGAFNGCVNLATITFASGSNNLIIADAYDYEEMFVFGNTGISEFNSNGRIVRIGQNAFNGSTKLTSLTLDNVSEIGNYAFYGCTALSQLSLSDVDYINSYAFAQCIKLTNLNLYGLESIGSYAFYGCSSLANLSLSDIETIGNGAFSSCTNLSQATISDVNYIEDYVFEYCTKLSQVDIAYVQNMENTAFYSCNNLATVTLTAVDNFSFQGYNSLITVYMNNIEDIPDSAFYECYNLKNVILSGAEIIGSYAFYGCSALANIDFSGITTIESYAFSECDSLQSLNLTGVNSIGNGAFSYSNSLKSLTFIGGNSVGSNAFYACNSLIDVNLKNTRTIGSSAFGYCTSLKTLDITNVSIISSYAFENCVALNSLTLPTSLSGSNAIGYHAFAYCNNLEVVYIPRYFTTYSNLINSSAFNYCYNLHEIYNYSGSYITPGQTSSIFGNLSYYALVVNTSENVARLQKATVNNVVYKYNNSNAWIVGYTGSYGTVRLGDSVKLGQKTFSSYDIATHSFTSGIGTLYINSAVNEIYANAFSGVSSVVLHNGYTNINPDAFASYGVTCYFKGTQSEFYSKGYDSYLFYSVYYYTDCVHNSNEWTERSGIITTQRSYLYQITENATCTEYGAYRYYCEYCNHTYSTGSINKLGHSISSGYYDCNRCDYFKTADITIYNYQSYAMQKLANIQLNGFENLSTYEFASNNQLTENTATITIVAKRDMIIDLDYALFATGKETITMSGGGKNITIDGEIDFSIGGSVDNSQGSEQFDLSAGQSLVITFSLNGEIESTAYAVISNIVISMR